LHDRHVSLRLLYLIFNQLLSWLTLLPAHRHPRTSSSVALADLVDDPLILVSVRPGDERILSWFTASGVTPRVRWVAHDIDLGSGPTSQSPPTCPYSMISRRGRPTRVPDAEPGIVAGQDRVRLRAQKLPP
jgi:hypothetical protein